MTAAELWGWLKWHEQNPPVTAAIEKLSEQLKKWSTRK